MEQCFESGFGMCFCVQWERSQKERNVSRHVYVKFTTYESKREIEIVRDIYNIRAMVNMVCLVEARYDKLNQKNKQEL